MFGFNAFSERAIGEIGVPFDTIPPTMVGSLSYGSITTTSFILTWQAATDNIGVAGYKFSVDGGSTYTDIGNVLTVTCSGLTAGVTYNVRVYAYDAANNIATPLTATVTTSPAYVADTTPPVMSGSIVITGINSGGFTLSYDAATDNIGIAGYEVSVDTGTASFSAMGNVQSVVKTGLSSSTQYNVRVRAFDSAGNRSNIITATATTVAAQQLASSLSLIFKNRAGVVQANLTGMKWAFFDAATPDSLSVPSAKGTGASTNAGGAIVLNITGTKLPPGSTGWLIFSNSDGTTSQSNLISFAGPCTVA